MIEALKRTMTTTKSRWLVLVLLGVIAGVGAGATAAYLLAPAYEKLPTCTNEDGNPDGNPCWWTDPGTGTRYYVTSENYR